MVAVLIASTCGMPGDADAAHRHDTPGLDCSAVSRWQHGARRLRGLVVGLGVAARARNDRGRGQPVGPRSGRTVGLDGLAR